MSEKATLTPSVKKYEGPKYNLTEDLTTLTTRIMALDKAGVATRLGQYSWIVPGKDATKNTFEMMALYQGAMNQIDWGERVAVDGRFGPEMHKNLKIVQKTLNITPQDGLPGPKTTEALINALQPKTPPTLVPQVAPTAPASVPAPVPAKTPDTLAVPASVVRISPAPVPVAPTAILVKPKMILDSESLSKYTEVSSLLTQNGFTEIQPDSAIAVFTNGRTEFTVDFSKNNVSATPTPTGPTPDSLLFLEIWKILTK